MTTESEANPEKKFVPALLPWLIAAGALAFYLVTLNRWVSSSSLQQVARLSGWTWQPELYGPCFLLVTYPFRWLPAQMLPLALNLFAAVCAALTLALLARSVALLPQDRTLEQRHQQQSKQSLLSIPAAWLPPVLAVLVCGLQLTFWEYATAMSSPPVPWGSGCEMLDLLLFAYVLRCLLEFRLEHRESWLLRAAFVFGAAITNNWAMIGFFPVFLLALVWIRGFRFFNLGFLARMALWGAVGLSLYLLLPLWQSLAGPSSLPFWSTLKANVAAQKNILTQFYGYGKHELALLALTSLVPVFIMGIRWRSYFADTSQIGIALASFMFRVVHALFLIACIWVAFDPPFSPRNKGFGAPFLTFYYLGALAVGYCSGYFLLLFSGKPSRSRRGPPKVRLIDRCVTGGVWLLVLLVPCGLIYRNLPQIRITNGPLLKNFAALLAQALPSKRAVLLSDDSRRLLLLQAYVAQTGRGKEDLFLDTAALALPDYHRFLTKKHPRVWTSNPPKSVVNRAEPFLLVQLLSRLAQTNDVFYLHPSFGYYFEFYYPESHGLVYRLVPYSTNLLFAPQPSPELIAENETFWAKADEQALQPLLAASGLPGRGKPPGFLQDLIEKVRLGREPNHDAATVAGFYSRALDYWGAEMQRAGRLKDAAAHFERALELNPDNPVARVNLECNKKLALKGKSAVQVSKSIEDEFGKYRKWDDILNENGPFDEPNFCFEQGRVFVSNNLYRQAAAQFDRVRILAPENIAARIWLGQLYVISGMPDQALKLLNQILDHPELREAVQTNRVELLFVEASAYLALDDLRGAEAAVRTALRQHPGDADLLASATQVYMKYGSYFDNVLAAKAGPDTNTLAHMRNGCFSNALLSVEQQLSTAPTNLSALINKGYLCMQAGAYDQAIPPLTKVLTMDTNNNSALLNRAIAYLRCDKLEAARRDYEALQKTYPSAFQIYYGLGEIAWRKRDTNAAIQNFELYLANAQTNSSEAKLVSARLNELRPGSH